MAEKTLLEKLKELDAKSPLQLEAWEIDSLMPIALELAEKVEKYEKYFKDESIEAMEIKMEPYYEAMAKLSGESIILKHKIFHNGSKEEIEHLNSLFPNKDIIVDLIVPGEAHFTIYDKDKE